MVDCSCVTAVYGLYEFDPVPLMAISKKYTRKDNENKLIGDIEINFTGTLLPNLGVNAPSGNQSRIVKLRTMQDQLKDALSTDRENLFIVDASGITILNVYPRVESLNFDESILVQKSDYDISFSVTEEEQDLFVENATDSWETTINEDGTRTVTHTVSAKGIRGDYGTKLGDTPVNNAKDFVLSKISENPALQQFFIDMTSYDSYNHTKQESKSECDGTYSITETWILNTESFIDDRNIETSTTFALNGDPTTVLSITGTIIGLDVADEPTPEDRLAAAQSGFDNTVKAEIGFDAVGVTSKSTTTNAFAGTLAYSVETNSSASGVLTNKSIDRSFDRNDDGSTTQTVTISAEILPQSSGVIQDIIDFVDLNMAAINSINPPFSVGNSVQLSRQSSRNDTNKTYSQTNIYIDAANSVFREEVSIDATLDEDGFLNVTVNGTVFGLKDESTTSSEERFSNAETGFNGTVEGLILSRAQSIADEFTRTLKTTPTTQVLGHNPKAGTVSYSRTFNDKPEPPEGILKQQVEISDSGGDPVVATIPIPGRAAGPVFQIMSTRSVFQRTVNIDWTLEEGTSESSADGKAETVLIGFAPTELDNDIFVVQSKSFSEDTGKYRFTATWTYNASGSAFRLSIPGEI